MAGDSIVSGTSYSTLTEVPAIDQIFGAGPDRQTPSNRHFGREASKRDRLALSPSQGVAAADNKDPRGDANLRWRMMYVVGGPIIPQPRVCP